jgi:DNA-binding MarR family transcriptional regulator
MLKANSAFGSRNGIKDELDFLFAEVAALAKHLKKAIAQIHRQDDLPSGGRSVLQGIHRHGPQTVPQLARERSSSRQHVQVLVDRLAAAGHVEFRSNPAHKRSDLIYLTERGEEMLGTATEREANFLAPLLPYTTEAELLSVATLLHRMRGLLVGQEREHTEVVAKVKRHKPRQRRQARVRVPRSPKGVVRMAADSTPGEAAPAIPEEATLPVNLL